MKIAFYKHNVLNKIITKLFASETKSITCQIGFSEELNGDCVEFYENEGLVKTVKMQEIFTVLSTHLGEEITHYDVMEVGDFGECFVFFLKERVATTRPKFKVA
ncbi:hypothetical protein SMD22_01060 (plasmid) [Brevibacillus halotolerans]|nr:hypothetical protein SMD22_01060 [Brevibacillus halotolerans]